MNKLKLLLRLGRYENPTGGFLLFLPALLSYAVNARLDNFPFKYVFLCFVGAMVARGAGCTINDIWDRNFDKHVLRTKSRPIASGQLSIFEALIFFVLQLAMALLILLQFPLKAIMVGFVAVPFIIVYPLMKRIIVVPQLFLGITFSLPILFAAHSLDSFNFAQTLILFVLHTIMVFAYDTVYAYQDIDDDIKIGVKSSAITLSKYSRASIFTIYLLIFALLFLLGFLGGYNALFFVLNSLLFLLVFYLLLRLDFRHKGQCLNFFKSNQYLEFMIVIIIIIGRLF